MKGTFNVTHSSPRNDRHRDHGWPQEEHQALVRRQKQERGGSLGQKPLLGFPWGRQGSVNNSGLESYSNFSRLWARVAVSNFLVPGPLK